MQKQIFISLSARLVALLAFALLALVSDAALAATASATFYSTPSQAVPIAQSAPSLVTRFSWTIATLIAILQTVLWLYNRGLLYRVVDIAYRCAGIFWSIYDAWRRNDYWQIWLWVRSRI